jgi:nucleolar pre-ribosomal-associated protein 1
VLSDSDDRSAKLDILREYLEAVKPRIPGEDAVFLPDIMEMWSFAVQVANDGVMSSVAVVLALLLQVVSASLQLVPHGLGICQTLLQERQLKSLSRNLSADKNKAFIISPTLRMLREAVCLDGGAYAKPIVRARNFTFTSLGRNLEIGHVGDTQEDLRKSSVRTNAVRFFLSCLKYLHSEGKKELLTQKELLSHLTFMIKSDPPHLVLQILDTLKTHILMDDKIPREVKFRTFGTKTLIRFLALYTYTETDETVQDQPAVSEKVHQFLIYACTTPKAGVLYPYGGLYPKESEERLPARAGKNTDEIDDDVWDTKYTDNLPVYNFVLSEFARKLRPWSSLKHSELLVAIFTVAPELIADYFLNNRAFTFEPKLSMTWIGYAAFLFNTMTIPLPASFGDRTRYAKAPPPTSIILHNVIPLPITQKVLVRCLSPKSNLTSFFATRILVLALEKLSAAIKMLEDSPSAKTPTWVEARRRVVDAFCQRIPDMKEIVRAYKSIPAENTLHKTLTSRLLRLYYEVIPKVALAANFDVSPFFVDVLKSVHESSSEPEARALAVMELENLVSIASYSPGMRWFAKVDNLSEGVTSSPFTALLRLLCSSNQSTPLVQLKKVLTEVAIENQLVSPKVGLRPLLRVLRLTLEDEMATGRETIWSFLDNCLNRCATSPIKYLELMDSYLQSSDLNTDNASCTLLNLAIIEQLPYVTKTAKPKEKAALAKILSMYFAVLAQSSENQEFTKNVYKKIKDHFAEDSVKMKDLAKVDLSSLEDDDAEMAEAGDEAQNGPSSANQNILDSAALAELLHVPFEEEDDASALVRWSTKSVEDLVEDDWAIKLIRLLCSTQTHIRKEALTNLLKMAAKIKESSYEEKEQVWLMLSELIESSRPHVDAGPVPSAFAAFASHSLEILRNPLHPLYPKTNSYLTRGPVWPRDKLPMAHDILHGAPADDDRYYTELTWLLTYFLDCLRTPFDLGVFHRKRWFEKVLALGSGNPHLRWNLRTRVLRIVYRATCIEGGSTTLVTRFGVIGWLDAQRAASEVREEAAVYAALMVRVWETCDQDKVRTWSKGGVEKLLDDLKQL